MKLNRIKVYKSKILKLKLIQTKVYKKNYKNFIKIEDIITRFKKALHIIYNYHINNRRILFVGASIQLSFKIKKIFKNTQHIIIPEHIWMPGIITNQEPCFKYLSKNSKPAKNKISEILFQLKKKSDLIVILDFFSSQEAANEAYLTRIPFISLNCDLKLLDNKSSYKVPGNFRFTKKKLRDMIFYTVLVATLKKKQRKI